MNKTIKDLIEPSKKTLIALLSRNLPPETTREQLEAIIDQEIFNFEYRFILNPEFAECEEPSIEAAFRKTIMQNLSFDQDFGLIWMMNRNAKIGQKDVKLLECNKTVNGWISLYRQAGSLDDLESPIVEYDPVTGCVSKVKIGLIVANYSNGGEITQRETKWFEFDEKDFRLWQQKSHNLKKSKSTPGNDANLSLSGENYWNFAPKGKTRDGKTLNGVPSPEQPGSISPSFAITKCTRHALTRAKLNANPYARKNLKVVEHRRYVETIKEEEAEEIYREEFKPAGKEYPDFTVQPPIVQNTPIEKNETVDDRLKSQAEKKVLTPELEKQILDEVEAGNNEAECLVVYNKWKSVLSENPALMNKFLKIGKDRKANPRQPKTGGLVEPVETSFEIKPVENEKITSDDLI